MIKAGEVHKERVIEILTGCFDSNKTVNWIVKQDSTRKERIRYLLDYSFETCLRAGLMYITDNLNGVILCSLSDNKLPFLEEAYLTLQFILKVTGIPGIRRALKREEYIKQFHSKEEEFIYIWFLGVDKAEQGKGTGSALVQEVVNKSNSDQLPIYLETSVEANLGFYSKHGFQVYHTSNEATFGYKLYFLRRYPNPVS